MLLDFKKLLNIIILFIGSVIFLWFLKNNNLNMAIIVLSLTLIIWVLISLILENFDLKSFAWIVSSSGFLLSISIFFLFGVEEVPFPVGAFVFHAGGIAIALGVCFFSIFPLLFLYQGNSNKKIDNLIQTPQKEHSQQIENEPHDPIVDSDDWELVSEEDLHSGDYEI